MSNPLYCLLMVLAYPIGIPALYAYAFWDDREELQRLAALERAKQKGYAQVDGGKARGKKGRGLVGAAAEGVRWVAPRVSSGISQGVTTARRSVVGVVPALNRAASTGRTNLRRKKAIRQLRRHVQSLVRPYKCTRFYYELCECGRKIALTGIPVLLSGNGVSLRGTTGACMCMCAHIRALTRHVHLWQV
jgi:hypothetical protein